MHAIQFFHERYQSHPDLRAHCGQNYILFTPGPELQQHINTAQDAIFKQPDQKETIYQQFFPAVTAAVGHLSDTLPQEAQALTLYSTGAFPTGVIVYWGFEGLREAFAHDLVLAIPDTPLRPLPVTSDNCRLYGIPDDEEQIREANKRLGKQWRGCISGVWARRTSDTMYNPRTGLLRIDLDDGTLSQIRGILRHLRQRGFAFICAPSFSAREDKHKCHLFIHDSQQVTHDLIADRYAGLVRFVLGDEYWHLHDASQGRATQLTYLTAVARRLQDPDFAIVMNDGSTSWTEAIHRVQSNQTTPTAGPTGIAGGRRVPRDRTREADLVAAAWPHPLCAALIATCDRHQVALVSCLRLASDRRMSAPQQFAFLEQLAKNIAAVRPNTTHTFPWLVRQLRADQNITFRC